MYASKFIILCTLTVTIAIAMPDQKEQCVGCSKPVDLEKAAKDLSASLEKLAAGDGPNFKLGKVHSAEIQVVAGTLTKIVADLIDADGKTKNCKVTIWSRPWLPDGIEVTFECEGEDKIVRKHSA